MDYWTALVVSDLHTGFKGALWPKGFVWDGRSVNPNKLDEYLWSIWGTIEERLPPTYDFLIEVGDPYQGFKPLRGWTVYDPDPGLQAEAHISILRPLRERANEYFMVLGSPWHEGESAQGMRLIGEKLHATPAGEKIPAFDWLPLDLDGILLDFAHHISRAPVYPMTPLIREGRASRSAEAAISKGQISHYVFRAHRHCYEEHISTVDDQIVGEVTLPTLKLMEWYAIQKIGPNQALANYNLGVVFVKVYPQHRGHGLKTVHVEPMLYPKPKVQVVKRRRKECLTPR